MTKTNPVSLLILGAGWTSEFLIPQLEKKAINYAATSTTGRPNTIQFKYDPDSKDTTPFKALPAASTILITFPLTGAGQSRQLTELYAQTHKATAAPNWIQLGSSGIFQIPGQELWVTRKSRYDVQNKRAVAEDELLGLGGCVLNLSGLWGGQRQPKNWVGRVAKSKVDVAGKDSVHFVHGEDVAQAIIAVMSDFTAGERWLVTDMFVYDWWSLILGWSGDLATKSEDALPYGRWVAELMREKDIRALPRSMEVLGRAYDTRDFWDRFSITPARAGLQ